MLTGVPDNQCGVYKEWKYFSRDVVKQAVAEVNQITGLKIEPIEFKRGRSVTDLQFRVARKVQPGFRTGDLRFYVPPANSPRIV